MACDLHRIFGHLAQQLPNDDFHSVDNDCFVLSTDNLPPIPPNLTTDQLCLTWTYHIYNSYPVELVEFHGTKTIYRYLALLVLAKVFHPKPPQITLQLTSPRSSIKRLVLDYTYDVQSTFPGYITQPLRFNYYPAQTKRHPWVDSTLTPDDLPVIRLTNEIDLVIDPVQFAIRDTLFGFGNDQACCLFAELLLNASALHNDVNEYNLEGECGFRGVGRGSAEINLWLPGSIGFDME